MPDQSTAPKNDPASLSQDRKNYVHSLFCIYRKYVEHEDELIHQRSTWMYTIHGFLFAAYGLLLGLALGLASKGGTGLEHTQLVHLQIVLAILAFAGALSGGAGTLSLSGAARSIIRLDNTWKRLASKYHDSAFDLPGLTGGGVERNKRLGRYETYLFPSILFVAWLLLIVVSVIFLNKSGASDAFVVKAN